MDSNQRVPILFRNQPSVPQISSVFRPAPIQEPQSMSVVGTVSPQSMSGIITYGPQTQGGEVRPRIDVSMSPEQGPMSPESMIIDNNTIMGMTQSLQPSIQPPEYAAPSVCGNPILPQNSNIVFPPQVIKYITESADRTKSLQARVSSRKIVEKYLIERGSCQKLNPTIFNDARLRTFRIDDAILGNKLATEETLNASIHDDIACTVDSIIYDGKQVGDYTPLQRERIRDWLPKIKQIGAESVEGYALKSSPSDNSDLFVMKAPRNPKNDELIHEAVIGFYAMNKLRHILPNYMYVYGYTRCSPPTLQNKEVITWCSSSNPPVSYLITENIRDAEAIGDFVINPKTTALDFIAVFLQVLNALNLAYKTYGYTHYDLHYGNIMVRTYSKIMAIPYYGTSFKGDVMTLEGFIATKNIPYIIDYGYSRITVGGYGFGKMGLESFGINGDQAFPMYDVYKILGFLGEKIYLKGSTSEAIKIRDMLEIMFSFFGEGTLQARVAKRLKGNDWYSAPEKYRSITHDDYITWLTTKSGLSLPIHRNILSLMAQGVYQPPINTNLDTCKFYNAVSSDKGPKTSLEYCEVVTAINQDSVMAPNIKQESLAWMNTRFNADAYFKSELPTINQNFKVISELYNKRLVPTTTNMIPLLSSSSNISTRQFVQIYKDHIIDLLRIKDLNSQMISFVRASICSLATQGTYQNHKQTIDRMNVALTEQVKFLNLQRQILKQNLEFAKKQNWKSLTSDSEVIKFWRDEHESLILAV